MLEPDFTKVTELALHGRTVANISQRFAKVLGLPPHQVETIRIAALVHDVGMRLLDYERFYRRPNLTAEELRGLAEHPVVGAALVEPLLGSDVAQAVLRHHERVDGKGYPSRLSGNQIPLTSRVIQICDAWVAMTSPHSYQPTLRETEVMARLREGAGTQFDLELVEKFLASVDEIADR
jgi:HD-GYP domain-containing protein (c-di-GMP phosphodiesterase class II)